MKLLSLYIALIAVSPFLLLVPWRLRRAFCADAVLACFPSRTLTIRLRGKDQPGLVALAASVIEDVSKALYIQSLDYQLRGSGRRQHYDLELVVAGDPGALRRLQAIVKSRSIYESTSKDLQESVARARLAHGVGRSAQYALSLEVLTVDETQIIKNVAEIGVAYGGTIHSMHAHTQNTSDRFPNSTTADFFIEARLGFATLEASERAIAGFKRLSYDVVTLRRMYQDPPHDPGAASN